MSEMKCPVTGKTASAAPKKGTSNRDWWPNQLNLKILNQNSKLVSPMDEDFNTPKSLKKLDYFALKQDLYALMTGLSGLVACRLRTLRTPVYQNGLAQCRYIPYG
jgi:catalase-peroxidase